MSAPGRSTTRLAIAVLAGVALGSTVALAIGLRPFFAARPTLPPPPAIIAERGELPTKVVAFEARVDGRLVGSGFLLELTGGDVIGVTTAHSLGPDIFHPVTYTPAGRDESVAQFDELYAPLGQPRTGADLTIDYVLMRPRSRPDPSLVLQPDPRGAPQPGERVLMYSGLGDGQGGQQVLPGTVESVDEDGAWIRMDDVFDPGLMSGSPVLSQHTGKVVGMIIVMNWIPGTLRIGVNPVKAIVEAARP